MEQDQITFLELIAGEKYLASMLGLQKKKKTFLKKSWLEIKKKKKNWLEQ